MSKILSTFSVNCIDHCSIGSTDLCGRVVKDIASYARVSGFDSRSRQVDAAVHLFGEHTVDDCCTKLHA